VDLSLKSYLKYQYRPFKNRSKSIEKQAFLKAINRSLSDYFYNLYLLKKRSYYFFYFRKTNLEPLKEQESADFQFKIKAISREKYIIVV
jgi:hypothetical protein